MPQINLDILDIIISYLQTPELVQLSTVCKLYRTLARKKMLSVVVLDSDTKLSKFCAFVLADVSTRAPCIRSLSIPAYAFDWNVNEHIGIESLQLADISTGNLTSLTAVLMWCRGLTCLHMAYVANLIEAYPPFGHSIASLTSLKVLDIFEAKKSPLISQLLCDMQSRLRTFRMYYNMDNRSRQDFPLRDPAAYPSTASIENLDLYWAVFPPSDARYSPWPSVRRFVSAYCRVVLDHMPAVLPNLQVCRLRDGTVEHRQRFPLWKSLGSLDTNCSLHQLRWNGCPTHRLFLDDCFQNGSVPRVREVNSLLRECQPLLLVLDNVQAQQSLEFWRMLRIVVPDLRGLDCAIRSYLVFMHPGFLTCLLQFLADLPLIHLKINVHYYMNAYQRGPSPMLSDIFTSDMRQEFASRIPTLHYLTVSPAENPYAIERWSCDWWRIIRSKTPGDKPQLERLTRAEGDKVEGGLRKMDRDSLLHFDIDKFVQALTMRDDGRCSIYG